MFGFFRFYLAWMVVVTHISVGLHHAGGFAVYSFYILSGYLMTYIMNNNYGYTSEGMARYALNRFLRIFPPYWVVAAITLIFILMMPEYFYSMHKSLRVPETFYEIVSNITIFGLMPGIGEGETEPYARLVPASWALHVELCFYVAIGLFLGKRKDVVIVWLLLSILYHVFAVMKGWPRYAPVYAASLAFSLGSFLFHYRDIIRRYLPQSSGFAALALTVFVVFTLTVHLLPMEIKIIPFYINMIFSAVLVILLSNVKTRSKKLKAVDNFLGDLSYPIYLSQWLVAVLVSQLFGLDKSVALLLMVMPFLLAFSVMIKYLVDDPIEKVRRSISDAGRKGN